MENSTLFVVDESGKEKEMEILFTFADEEKGKQYVLYVDPQSDTGEVFVSSYTDEGELNPVESEEEWAMVEEVFGAYVDEQEKED